MKSRVLAAVLLLPMVAALRADGTFSSGPGRVALIELYTSEGCSSCPPAEQWLARLREMKGLWTSFVPLAFHVHYWDYLGWKDELASPAFTEREHAYGAAWHSVSVYTPCFVRNGHEWRPDRDPQDASIPTGEAGRLKITWQAPGRVKVDYMPAAKSQGLEVAAALLGCGIVSRVRAGENHGRTLTHEFVVLQLRNAALQANDSGGFSATIELPPRANIKASRHAIAVWVTKRGALMPLQAAGGWID